MRLVHRHIRLVFCLLALALLPNGAAGLERYEDRFVDEAGRPVVLAWAFGLTSADDLPQYAACGLNTVYIDLPADDEQMAAARGLAEEAGRQGFYIVLGLNPATAVSPDEPFAVGDPALMQASARWLADTVAGWQATPGLVAYGLQHDLESRLAWPHATFVAYLRHRYGDSVRYLGNQWGLALPSFEALTPDVLARAAARGVVGVSRPSLDHARWKADSLAALHRQWTGVIQALDPVHPVLGGRMDRHGPLLAAPSDLMGLQPAFLPGRDGDRVYHHVEAVSVAHRAGRFAVFPTLASDADPASLLRWTRLVFGRGAAGVGYARWSALRGDGARRQAVARALEEARAPAAAGFTPEAGAAVVLQPLVRGPVVDGRALFGFGAMGGDEPAALLRLLRESTRHGPLAVLAPDDLASARLETYGTLFLAATFDLSPAAIDALRRYVDAGGVVLADLGVGSDAVQGDLASLPPALSELFGVQVVAVQRLEDALVDRFGDRMRASAGAVAFPQLPAGLSQPGSLVVKRRSSVLPDLRLNQSTGRFSAPKLLDSPTAFVVTDGDARMIAEQFQLDRVAPGKTPTAGLAQNPYGRGYALYASTFLWQDWPLDDEFFARLHDNLVGYSPRLSIADTAELSPAGLMVAAGEGRLWMHRLTDSARTLTVDVGSMDGGLYAGGLNVLQRAPAVTQRGGVRSAREPLINRRVVQLGGGELRVEAPLPVRLWPLGESSSAAVEQYGPEGIELRVFGAGEQANQDHLGRWWVDDPEPSTAVITVADGAYPVTPGSTHRLVWREFRTDGVLTHEHLLTAGPEGTLVIRGEFTTVALLLSPAPSPS